MHYTRDILITKRRRKGSSGRFIETSGVQPLKSTDCQVRWFGHDGVWHLNQRHRVRFPLIMEQPEAAAKKPLHASMHPLVSYWVEAGAGRSKRVCDEFETVSIVYCWERRKLQQQKSTILLLQVGFEPNPPLPPIRKKLLTLAIIFCYRVARMNQLQNYFTVYEDPEKHQLLLKITKTFDPDDKLIVLFGL